MHGAARDVARVQSSAGRTPRLGFLGAGWIGRHRLKAIANAGGAEVVAIADPTPGELEKAMRLVPGARAATSLQDLISAGIDGVVIATPSALHAAQSIEALEAGLAVFCQKPLGRTAAEVATVLQAATRADRLLGVDLSYRETAAMRSVRDLVSSGGIGEVYAADLVFHNAYGPDKPWFYDAALSGGGCLIDLGVHLVDLALWVLGNPGIEDASGRLFAGGKPWAPERGGVEDYAVATLDLAGGRVVRLACSWRLHAGRDAVISAAFHGSAGSAVMHNVVGSFYDFVAEHWIGTRREVISDPPDDWGGRAAVAWVTRLAEDRSFDPAIGQVLVVSDVLDRLYGRQARRRPASQS